VHQLDKIILKQNQLFLFFMFILLSGDYIEYLELFAMYRKLLCDKSKQKIVLINSFLVAFSFF